MGYDAISNDQNLCQLRRNCHLRISQEFIVSEVEHKSQCAGLNLVGIDLDDVGNCGVDDESVVEGVDRTALTWKGRWWSEEELEGIETGAVFVDISVKSDSVVKAVVRTVGGKADGVVHGSESP